MTPKFVTSQYNHIQLSTQLFAYSAVYKYDIAIVLMISLGCIVTATCMKNVLDDVCYFYARNRLIIIKSIVTKSNQYCYQHELVIRCFPEICGLPVCRSRSKALDCRKKYELSASDSITGLSVNCRNKVTGTPKETSGRSQGNVTK